MPEYICNCCAFQSKDKTLYKKHLETLKHKRLSNNMEGQEALMNEITVLKEEIKTLKLKVEVYKDVIKMQGLKSKKVESEDEDELYNWDTTKFMEEVEIDAKDVGLIEEVASLRTADDKVKTITLENAFEAFFHNEKNNLPFLKDYLKILENPDHLGDLVIEKVLNECSFKVTNKYEQRFKIYKDGWLKPSVSDEMLSELISDVIVNLLSYSKLFQHYYSYDSKLREMDKYKVEEIKPKIQQLNAKFKLCSTTKTLEYICKKMSD